MRHLPPSSKPIAPLAARGTVAQSRDIAPTQEETPWKINLSSQPLQAQNRCVGAARSCTASSLVKVLVAQRLYVCEDYDDESGHFIFVYDYRNDNVRDVLDIGQRPSAVGGTR